MNHEDIANEFKSKFREELIGSFNSNTTYGTPIFLINIENGIPIPYCTTVEHFFRGNDYLDLTYFFKELDKNKQIYFVVNDDDNTEAFIMNY